MHEVFHLEPMESIQVNNKLNDELCFYDCGNVELMRGRSLLLHKYDKVSTLDEDRHTIVTVRRQEKGKLF